MNKRDLSEADIEAKYITPAIINAGWDELTQISRQKYFTDGRIYVKGKVTARGEGKRADYILFYKPNIPIAVVESKDNKHSVKAGIQQALDYANILDIPFVFSSNGNAFYFHDKTATDNQEELDDAIVTNDFWYFQIDEKIILKELFLELTATVWFDEICKKGSDGTTQRIRLQKDKFFNQKVWLPEKDEQEAILNKIKSLKENINLLKQENEHHQNLLDQLRQSILQDAIQGKLTADWRKQNSNAESASELLKRIKVEKVELSKEKKTKKEKHLPPISESEIPFELPKGWAWCRLGEIAQHNAGKTLSKGQNTGLYRDCITTSNIYWGKIQLEKVKQIQIEDSELERCTVSKGDLLICEGGDVGRSAIWDKDYNICFQNHIHRIRFYCNMNQKYFYYCLMYLYFSKSILDYKKGMGIGNLSGSALSSITFPLPPLAEQQAIVAKVETLLEKCNQLQAEVEQQNAQSKDLLKALFCETFKVK